ncbi:LysR substrate-binding domain-containing protein [Micromonospora avicenniae]|uniref:LysR substrate-binding domain-containing protein n=1 Tax=Micromonospora avicenniae TaxID=1198245 RepID=UPI00332B1501
MAAVRGLLRGSLAVGTEQCLGVIDLPPLLASFRRAHPGVEIRLRYAGSGHVAEQIRLGRLDFSADWGARRVNDQTFARARAERRISVEVNDGAHPARLRTPGSRCGAGAGAGDP